nr:MAG TPA: hypothetical protein [Caudoviricetes sp.]
MSDYWRLSSLVCSRFLPRYPHPGIGLLFVFGLD